MLIKVEQKHIDSALEYILSGKNDGLVCQNCPVALALNEATGKKYFVGPTYYNLSDIYGSSKDKVFPEHVTEWICNFDKTGKGKPFEFEADVC